MSETTERVVCDAGPIIHLDELDALDLLADFAIHTPETVWLEVTRHRPRALKHAALASSQCYAPQDERVADLASVFGLAAGECEALALAHRGGDMLLTDDAAARLAAEGLGLRVHGTLGVIVRSARVGRRSPQEVIELLSSVPRQSSLHLRASLLATVIDQVRAAYKL